MIKQHVYNKMTPEMRPQGPGQDLKGWTFVSAEHGGEYPDSMPQCLWATDAEGRKCLYTPITESGKVVDSRGFYFNSEG